MSDNYWKKAWALADLEKQEESEKLDEWQRNQVKAEQIKPPEASPLVMNKTRPPDGWVVDQNGQRIPTWATDEDTKPKWKSKIFITQLVMLGASLLSMFFGFDLTPETQSLITEGLVALMGGGSILTIIFRLFFTDKKLV